MKKLMAILSCLCICLAVQAQTKKTTIVNTWEYAAPNAPYGYQNGTILVKEKEGKLSGEVKIQQSTVVIQEIKKEKDQYSCSFYIDGQAVDLSFKQKGANQLEGVAFGGGMEIPFTCKTLKK